MTTSCSPNCTCGDYARAAADGVGRRNPVLVQALGICSALAVTGMVSTTLVMCAALLFVASASSLIISLLREWIPHRVRLIYQMLVISTMVILVDLYLKAYWVEMSGALGPYVGLIITNCLILGRCEGYALRNGPLLSALDGLGSAAGYGLVLLAIAVIREPIGQGELLGYAILPAGYERVQLIAGPPGAFLAMGVIVWIVRSIWPEPESSEHPEAG
jgi:Na+-transporting NADH:ubiquinone oxidoreductase subunit D